MKNCLKTIAAGLVTPFLKLGRQTTVKIVKIEATRRYIKVIKNLRHLFVYIIGLLLLLGIFASGFLMLHATAFLIIAILVGKKASLIIFFLLSVLYSVVPLIILTIACSEKNWLKYSECDAFLDRVLSKD